MPGFNSERQHKQNWKSGLQGQAYVAFHFADGDWAGEKRVIRLKILILFLMIYSLFPWKQSWQPQNCWHYVFFFLSFETSNGRWGFMAIICRIWLNFNKLKTNIYWMPTTYKVQEVKLTSLRKSFKPVEWNKQFLRANYYIFGFWFGLVLRKRGRK